VRPEDLGAAVLKIESVRVLKAYVAKTKAHLKTNRGFIALPIRGFGIWECTSRPSSIIAVDQSGHHLSRILDKFGTKDSNSCVNPLDNRPREKMPAEPEADIKIYRQAVGIVFFMLLSAPAYTVGQYCGEPQHSSYAVC